MEPPARSGDGRRCSLGLMPANAFGHFLAHFQARNVSLSVLLEMKLAALLGDGVKDSLAGDGHARMGIADDETDAMEAAGDERGEELAPVDLGLAQGGADAADGAFAIGAAADGDEHGTVAQEVAITDLFQAGVEEEIGTGLQWTLALELEFVIELGGVGTALGGADLVAAAFLYDFGDLASGTEAEQR